MRHIGMIIFVFLIGCRYTKENKTKDTKPKGTITFSGDYKICDTCKMTILVHHEECTTCGDITVDSGDIYLKKDLLKNINDLAVNTHNSKKSLVLSPNKIPIHELYFANKHYFNKLWKDKIGFKDFYKTFRLTGKIVEIRRRILNNGVVESYPSLFFKVEKAVEIDTGYLRRIIENK
jgi:hypothetical protein